ncbi:MAG TPA: alpha/beta hydrolase [Acidobacteriaceae bacterium]|jgi:pimeloyl-ACP methyl ester carboxylesterase|nr:alpha/beta hydrolase [Acidobacteriaceae bacterium]
MATGLLLFVAGLMPSAAGLMLFAAGAAWAAPAALSSKNRQRPTEPPVEVRSAAGLTEVGVLDGAAYRIDVPNEWNHSVIVYYHGYAQQPVTFHPSARLTGQLAPLLERHYAVIESAYSETGWALQQAYPETEALRRYFMRRFGQPRETYVVGRSMGGALVMITLELNPKPYRGGLDLCGSVGPSSEEFDRRFAWRAAFDAYFPGVMPPLVAMRPSFAAGFAANQAERERIAAALRLNPQGATAMRMMMGLRMDAELASDMAYFTYVIGDMQRRAGGNPFDNRNTIYSGTSATSSVSDDELNERVRRYAAQPGARAYLLRHYTPTGRLGRPMLAVHTIYDPVVPVAQLAVYQHEVQSAGFGENLVQQYVRRDGHCNVTPDEVGQAFDELVEWTHGAARPTAGVLKTARVLSAGVHEQARPAGHGGR